MNAVRTFLGLTVLGLSTMTALADPMCQLEDVPLHGTFADTRPRSELSGAALHGNKLLVLSNEAIGPDEDYYAVQVFEPAAGGGFRWVRDEVIYRPDGDSCFDADFEAIALSNNNLYVIGSHSSTHKKQSAKTTYKKNRKALVEFETEVCKNRRQLLEFTIDAQARISQPPRKIKTKDMLSDHPLLSAFMVLPSKENGIDIEGLAVKDGALFIGFRGPVLRENFVPVARLDISGANEPELLFVKLGGRGIRDMAATTDGFLILAGPTGDQEWSFNIYHWDGVDAVTGVDRPEGEKTKLLCTLPADPDGKPEGLAIVSRSAASAEVIIVYDSDKRLIARRGRIPLN